MIARAMGLQPRLVVADEAVSMLDVSMRVSVLDLLLSLRSEQQLAYVFISHDFGVVRYFSRTGRIIVMFFGVIVEEGPAQSVISHPRHPYTFLLLDAIPVPDPRLARRRRTEATSKAEERVTGEPSAVGCVFSNRCPFVGGQMPRRSASADRNRTWSCTSGGVLVPRAGAGSANARGRNSSSRRIRLARRCRMKALQIESGDNSASGSSLGCRSGRPCCCWPMLAPMLPMPGLN